MRESVKQRIIGVLVLAALAAVFVPVLFDLSPRQPIETETRIPPAPDIEPVMIPEPEQVAGLDKAKPAEEVFQPSEPDDVVEDASGDGAQVDDKPDSPDAPLAPVAEAEPVAAADPAFGLGEDELLDAWAVRVGSFSDSSKAQDLVSRLKHDGYKAYSRNAVSAGKPVIRVFVGPVVNKAQAIDYKQAIDKAYRVDALVLEFAP